MHPRGVDGGGSARQPRGRVIGEVTRDTSRGSSMRTSQKKSIGRRHWLLVVATAATLAMGCIVGGGAQGGSQDATLVVVGEGARTAFEIDNRSAESICYGHVSPTSDSNWGPDRLGPSEVRQRREPQLDPAHRQLRLPTLGLLASEHDGAARRRHRLGRPHHHLPHARMS